MAGTRRRKKKHADHEGHVDERWLVTYADLMTLLVALFMVLWSISAVNTSKYKSLQRSLAEAFSGHVMDGGQGIIENGDSSDVKTPAPSDPFSQIQASTGGTTSSGGKSSSNAAKDSAAAKAETEALKKLKRRVDAIAKAQGISGKVQTRLTPEGLSIRLLTDQLLFDSGSAVVKAQSVPLLRGIGKVLATEGKHPAVIEGHTDNVPIHGTFPSNWELSGARAAGIAREFISAGVNPQRLTAVGRAYLDPVATNSTAGGRSLNRRVEILLPRQTAVSKKVVDKGSFGSSIAPGSSPASKSSPSSAK
jgi:chemotaxis protein MotB